MRFAGTLGALVAIGAFAFGQAPADSPVLPVPLAPREAFLTGTAEAAQSKIAAAAAARSEMDDFLRTRAELRGETDAVWKIARTGTPEAMTQALESWRQKNAGRVEAMQQQAARIASAQVPPVIPKIHAVTIPRNATAELEEFMVERARLSNERAEIESRLRQSPAQADKAIQEWQRKNLGRFAAQYQRAGVIAEQNNPGPLPVPATPLIPRDASAELKAFLTERHTLLLDRVKMEARTTRLDAAGKDEALVQWEKEYGGRIKGLTEKARAISDKSSD